MLVSNPKKWVIDCFLDRGIILDNWGVQPYDKDRFFPGQLAILRVGVDGRSKHERLGKPKFVPGIYALCEIESQMLEGTGAKDEF